MADINLLPWRQEKRGHDKRTFIIEFLIAIAIILFLIVLIHINYSKKLNRQLRHNDLLQKEIRALTLKITEIKKFRQINEVLGKQIDTLQTLQYQRYQIVTLFNAITQLMPKGIVLSQMKLGNNKVSLKGQASTHLQISELIKKIDTSKQLNTPTLSDITTLPTTEGTKVTKFQLSLQLKPYKPLFPQSKKKGKKK